MANNTANVTAGKPKESGGVYRAPLGTTLPTDATTALGQAFVGLGFVSDAGMTQVYNHQSTDIKDWGGSTIYTTEEGLTDTYQFNMVEAINAEVLKVFFGDDNVTGARATGITVKGNSKSVPAACYVFELAVANGGYRRIVLPNAKPSTRENVQYVGNDVVGYGVTLTCYPDAQGNTHYEYTIKSST